MYYYTTKSDYLMHHGRKGQKWGIVNGPPYPLDQTSKEYKKTQNDNKNDEEADIDKLMASKKLISTDDASSLIKNGGKDKKRVLEAADLGIKAWTKIGRMHDEALTRGITGSDRMWFIFDDQTDGCFTAADLVNQGYNKSFINKLIDQADRARHEHPYDAGYFDLHERAFGDDYLDALIEIKSKQTSNNNDKHLSHSGVLGMHWGIRRYQNEDGTLTAEGRQHHAKIAAKYQSKLNSADRRAMKYTKKHDYADKRIVSMQDKMEDKGANNVSLGFEKRLNKLINSREKYSDAVKKIDKDIKKTVAKILDKGYDVSAVGVSKMYKNPNGLSKSPVWGHKYNIQKSDDRKGSLSLSFNNQNLGHRLHNESVDRRKRYSRITGVPFSSLK